MWSLVHGFVTYTCVTPGFETKLNAHSLCAYEQVFTHTLQKVNIETQCLKYINFIT
jgi:hypothetical protein